jgi:uncharacterized membrane protein YkvI
MEEKLMRFILLLLLVLAAVPLAGCEVAEGIFKAGIWVGAIAIALVVGIIAFVAAKIRG